RGDDVDPLYGAQFFAGDLDFLQPNDSLLERDAGINRSPQAFRLLKNLAYQVMRKLALLSHRSPWMIPKPLCRTFPATNKGPQHCAQGIETQKTSVCPG